MRLIIAVLGCLIIFFLNSGCQTPQERIIGIYDLDSTKGCSYCIEHAPKLLVFENMDLQSGILDIIVVNSIMAICIQDHMTFCKWIHV